MGSRIVIPRDVRANALVRRGLLWDGAHVPGAAKEIRAECEKDILFYINAFSWTYNPRLSKSPVVPFVTYGFQDEAVLALKESIENGNDVGIKKSRDMGATWVNLAVVEWFWHFRQMQSFLVVSRNEDYVDARGDPKALFWKIDFLLKHQPRWLIPRSVERTSMHIGNGDNGSVIDGESTTGDVGRGDRRTAILMDEFAAFGLADGFNALSSTQSTTDCRIYNSTPKGNSNAFAEVFKKAEALRVVTMHWSQHPEKNRGLYRSSRDPKTNRMVLELMDGWKGVVKVGVRAEKESTFRSVAFPEDYPFILDGKLRSPWYDRECARAVSPLQIAQELDIDFSGSDYHFFDTAAVDAYIDRWCRNPEATGDFDVDAEECRVIRFTENAKGHWRLFRPLDADGRYGREVRFVMGADVSAGTGASNSTIAVYDRATNEKWAECANPHILPDDFGRLLVAAARFFNDALVVPDRSGPTGETCVRRMLAQGYTNIYLRRNDKKVGAPVTNEQGVFLNPSTRTTVLYKYRDSIGKVAIINCSETAMRETTRFICKMDGSVEHEESASAVDPSGARANHGDLAIADALANLALTENAERERAMDVEPPEGTLAWRMREQRREEARARQSEELEEGWEP